MRPTDGRKPDRRPRGPALESRVNRPARPIDPRRIEVIDDATVAVLSAMTPAQRVERGLRMSAFVRSLLEAGIRLAKPEWNALMVAHEIKRRFAGAE